MIGLTPKQAACLDVIRASIEKHGIAPSFAEMQEALAIKSKSGIHLLVRGLETRGAIRVLPNRHRGIELRDPNAATDILSFLDDDTRDCVKRRAGAKGQRPETVVAEICRKHFGRAA